VVDIDDVASGAGKPNQMGVPLRKNSVISATVASLPPEDLEKFQSYLLQQYKMPDSILADNNFAYKFLHHLPAQGVVVAEEYLKTHHFNQYSKLNDVKINKVNPEETINWKDRKSIDFML